MKNDRSTTYNNEIIKIMLNIGKYGPTTPYKIEKILKIPHSTFSKRLKYLLNKGYIEYEREEIFRTGLKTRYIWLSTEGVLHLAKVLFLKIASEIEEKKDINHDRRFRKIYVELAKVDINEINSFFHKEFEGWFKQHVNDHWFFKEREYFNKAGATTLWWVLLYSLGGFLLTENWKNLFINTLGYALNYKKELENDLSMFFPACESGVYFLLDMNRLGYFTFFIQGNRLTTDLKKEIKAYLKLRPEITHKLKSMVIAQKREFEKYVRYADKLIEEIDK